MLSRVLLIAMLLPLCGLAKAEERFTPTLDLRLRHERVDDDAFLRHAEATTLRARLGVRIHIAEAWSALVEAEHTGSLLGQRFNSTANGASGFPVVADPNNTELNQAWLRYAPGADSSVTLGRQRLIHENHRFIGNVGWRQNEQTFDALDVSHRFSPRFSLRYSYLDRVQRIFGVDHPQPNQARWDLDTHLLAASATLGPGSLSGYLHLIENQSLPTSSHKNLGLRYVAKGNASASLSWQATLELARQRPYAEGASVNRASYRLLEGSLGWQGNSFSLGHEVLGGSGQYGFATPLATLHAFNGWADRFLATPGNGLQDLYLGWKRGFGDWNAAVVWHDFRADRGSAGYGREWDASLGRSFGKQWSLLLKAARYESRGFNVDVDKFWVSLEYRL